MEDSLRIRTLRKLGEPRHWTPFGWIGYLFVLYLVFALLVGLAADVAHVLLPSTLHVTVISGHLKQPPTSPG
jgi:hypothetical protein